MRCVVSFVSKVSGEDVEVFSIPVELPLSILLIPVGDTKKMLFDIFIETLEQGVFRVMKDNLRGWVENEEKVKNSN